MKIAVMGNDVQWEELLALSNQVSWVRMTVYEEIGIDADAFFLFNANIPFNKITTSKPVFVHAVLNTLTELCAKPNVLRMNAWPGFLSMSIWEIAGEMSTGAQLVLQTLGKQSKLVGDKPGFVSARIICMIINEAYFALEERVSTKEDIDIAMKLGTNYPYGPFEWASVIKVKNVFLLLEKLAQNDKRYTPSSLLKKETAE